MIHYDTFTVISGVLVIIGGVVMLVVVQRMYRAMKTMDDDNYDRALVRRRSRQLNVGTGLMQITIGLFLLSMGSYANSVPVLVMGVILILAAHYGLLTGEWWERRRPGRD